MRFRHLFMLVVPQVVWRKSDSENEALFRVFFAKPSFSEFLNSGSKRQLLDNIEMLFHPELDQDPPRQRPQHLLEGGTPLHPRP